MSAPSSGPEGPVALTLGGRVVPIAVRRDARARRLILRIARDGDGLVATLPPGVGVDKLLALAREKAEWIADRLERLPPRVPFADGAVVPFLGAPHVVRHRPGARRGVWREDGTIRVSGAPEHLPRRLTDWLRTQARGEIVPRVADKARSLGRAAGRVTIRDTRTRWGSCAAGGDLSFCWRLVMAPAAVLDYVVAHEVAHLAERGHGTPFWRLVATLTDEADGARAWLRTHGPGLHRYGGA